MEMPALAQQEPATTRNHQILEFGTYMGMTFLQALEDDPWWCAEQILRIQPDHPVVNHVSAGFQIPELCGNPSASLIDFVNWLNTQNILSKILTEEHYQQVMATYEADDWAMEEEL